MGVGEINEREGIPRAKAAVTKMAGYMLLLCWSNGEVSRGGYFWSVRERRKLAMVARSCWRRFSFLTGCSLGYSRGGGTKGVGVGVLVFNGVGGGMKGVGVGVGLGVGLVVDLGVGVGVGVVQMQLVFEEQKGFRQKPLEQNSPA